MVARGTTMARPRGRPKSATRTYGAVKLDRRLISLAKLVAAHRGTDVADLISELLEPTMNRAYSDMLRELKPET